MTILMPNVNLFNKLAEGYLKLEIQHYCFDYELLGSAVGRCLLSLFCLSLCPL